ncbi:MAG: hypothetical protein EZS28_030457 [Streblomastix strix]|uniref:Uncharacterized protein n=1 Tax=Streblomastix strix TaxID=222440 RepID=A0A5J4UUE9_9EUKA|nr:MAG: hypothetical protein EZS28_030457 [Streblomastix strix]
MAIIWKLRSNVPGLRNINDRVARFINYIEIWKENQNKLTNEIERTDNDQIDGIIRKGKCVHTTKSKHYTNGNYKLGINDDGMLLQATVNGDANPEVFDIKTSAKTSFNSLNGIDGLGESGSRAQIHAETNEDGDQNRHVIDSTGNIDDNQQKMIIEPKERETYIDLSMKTNSVMKQNNKITEPMTFQ